MNRSSHGVVCIEKGVHLLLAPKGAGWRAMPVSVPIVGRGGMSGAAAGPEALE